MYISLYTILINSFQLDIITINSVRRPSAIHKIKKLLGDGPHPLIVSTICEQEGLDNIDEIIKVNKQYFGFKKDYCCNHKVFVNRNRMV